MIARCRTFWSDHYTDSSGSEVAKENVYFTGSRLPHLLAFLTLIGRERLIALTECQGGSKDKKIVRVYYWEN